MNDAKNLKKILTEALNNNGYDFSESVQDQFVAYLLLLEQWNRVINLTAVRDPKEAVLLHILDSLSIRDYLHGQRIIDVGSGAGLPGIPLALACPDKEFTLLDSNSKKTRFLTQVCCDLKLKNVTVVHDRCEHFHPAEGFDSIMTRAFASLNAMLVSTQHLLGEPGQFLAMKGIYPETEINDIPTQFKLLAVHRLTIRGLDAERHLVCMSKS